MVEQFLGFINQLKLCNKQDKILLAISGGVDSMVMLDLFGKTGFEITIAHCNYQLRGADSDADQQLVEDVAKVKKIPIYAKTFDTEQYSGEHKVSIQMAARELRYEWFQELASERGYSCIATAHHKNDVLETVLLNVTKGTGLAGLHGIKPRVGSTIRPLLFATKAEIVGYAKDAELVWREDNSNNENKYQRNAIRNEVIPALKGINPHIESAVTNLTRHITRVEQIRELALDQFKSDVMTESSPDFKIDCDKMFLKANWSALLSELLFDFGFNASQIQNALDGLSNTGLIVQSTEWHLNVDRGTLILSPNEQEDELYKISRLPATLSTRYLQLIFEKKKEADNVLIKNKNQVQLDYDKLQFPLKLRTWQDGDKFVPLGMRGKKKISDFMIDNKIPLNLKKRQLLLLSGDEVAWVVGKRISDKFKVTSSTKEELQIKLSSIS